MRRSLPKRAAGPKHHDALHFSDVGAALERIDATNCAPSTKRAIRFTALTAARQIEVRRAAWEQFDIQAAVWVKPAESMKTGKAHRVPGANLRQEGVSHRRPNAAQGDNELHHCSGRQRQSRARPDYLLSIRIREPRIAAGAPGFGCAPSLPETASGDFGPQMDERSSPTLSGG